MDGGLKGGNYVDITLTKTNVDGTVDVTRINTIDTYVSGAPTAREQAAANLINSKLAARGDDPIILIPKNVNLEDVSRYLKGE